jgi:hypothetical protein
VRTSKGTTHQRKARARMSRFAAHRASSIYLDTATSVDSHDSRSGDGSSQAYSATWLSGTLPLPTDSGGPFAGPSGSMTSSLSASAPPSSRRAGSFRRAEDAFDRFSASTSRKLAALLGSKESVADTATVHSFSTKSSSGSSLSNNTNTQPFNSYKRSSALPHPYSSAAVAMNQSMIRDAERDEEQNCPVCLEPLSFRLPGEKPHVVPQCGHRLRAYLVSLSSPFFRWTGLTLAPADEACFEAVYGGMTKDRRRGGGSSLGLCGVCRSDMKIGDPPAHKNSTLELFGLGTGPDLTCGTTEFAAISGIPTRGQGGVDSHKMRSISKRTLPTDNLPSLHDPNEDDDLFSDPGERHVYLHGHSRTPSGDSHPYSTRRRGSSETIQGSNHLSTAAAQYMQSIVSSPTAHSISSNDRVFVAQPTITVRAEHSSIARNGDRSKKQHLTCMVTVEMPSRYPNARSKVLSAYEHRRESRQEVLPTPPPSTDLPPAPSSPDNNTGRASPTSTVYSSYAYAPTESIQNTSPKTNPFKHVVEDLQTRMLDWKGHAPDDFGRLKMYDYLSVRKDKAVREFLVRALLDQVYSRAH